MSLDEEVCKFMSVYIVYHPFNCIASLTEYQDTTGLTVDTTGYLTQGKFSGFIYRHNQSIRAKMSNDLAKNHEYGRENTAEIYKK